MSEERGAPSAPAPSSAVTGLVEGAVFAREFRVRRLLGRGGMGAVYEVEQLSTGRTRALKLMDPGLVTDTKSRERFVQEARAGSLIASDHVVEVVDAGIDPDTGTPWLAMELLQGESLAARLARGGAMPPIESREVLRQIGHALRAAHAAGVVHRDIKPENVFLGVPRRSDVACTVKILDFGIAKLLRSAQTAGRTTAGIGSPMWMAPEQAGAGQVSPATDVWAFGLLAYFMLTGTYYWRAANREDAGVTALLTEILVDPLEPSGVRAAAQGVAQRLPPGFDDWFARCVAREPTARFVEAGAALDALEPLLGGPPVAPGVPASVVPVSHAAFDSGTPAATPALAETIPSGPRFVPPAAVPVRRRTWLWAAAAGLVVGAAAVVVALFVWRGERNGRREPAEQRREAEGRSAVIVTHEDRREGAAGRSRSAWADREASRAAGQAVAADASAVVVAAAPDGGAPSPARAGTPAGDGPDAAGGPDAVAETGAAHVPAAPSAPHAPRGAMTPAGRDFFNAVVLPCWRDVLETAPQSATRVRLTVTWGPAGRVTNVAIRDVPTDGLFAGFRRCVVTHGTESFRFASLPAEPEVEIRGTLPAGP